MGLFFHKPEPPKDTIEVNEEYYDSTIGKISVFTPNDHELGKALGHSMQELAKYTHELKIGATSLETILRKSECLNSSYYRIKDFKIIKCNGEQLVDEVFISFSGEHNYDVRYKVSYFCPIELLPIWYKDYDRNRERVVKPDDEILWELICELNDYDGTHV